MIYRNFNLASEFWYGRFSFTDIRPRRLKSMNTLSQKMANFLKTLKRPKKLTNMDDWKGGKQKNSHYLCGVVSRPHFSIGSANQAIGI